MAAKQRLTKGRTKARQRKMHLIARLLDLPSTVGIVHHMNIDRDQCVMPGVHVMPQSASAHPGLPEGGGGSGTEAPAQWGSSRGPHQPGAERGRPQGPGGSGAGHTQVDQAL